MTTDRWIRLSDQDRQSAVELFSAAYAVGRLSREQLDERVTAAYSAKTHGELRDLTADLPRPAAPTGLPSETVVSGRAPQRASRCLVSMMIWMFFALVLSAGLAGLESPEAVWVAAIPIPIALLLTHALVIAWWCSTRAGTQSGRRNRRRICCRTGRSVSSSAVMNSSCANGRVTRHQRGEGGEGT